VLYSTSKSLFSPDERHIFKILCQEKKNVESKTPLRIVFTTVA